MPVIYDEQLAFAMDEESHSRRAWKVEQACERQEPRLYVPSWLVLTVFDLRLPEPKVIQHDLEDEVA